MAEVAPKVVTRKRWRVVGKKGHPQFYSVQTLLKQEIDSRTATLQLVIQDDCFII